MTFDEFAAKYCHGPSWRRSSDYAEDVRVNCAMSSAEIDAMMADRVPVDWDRISIGARVFVRWHGGNRGMYERRDDGIYAEDCWVAGGPGVMDLMWCEEEP